MIRFKIPGGFAAGLVTGVALALGAFAFAADKPKLPIEELRRFTHVFSLAKLQHVDQPEDRPLIDGSIRGILASLDTQSEYIDPAAWEELKDRSAPTRANMGLDMRVERKNFFILSALDGAPAERAGIRSGDVLVEINGTNVQNRLRGEVVRMLRGDPDRETILKVSREGVPDLLTFAVKTELIKQPTVQLRMLDNGIAYVRVPALVEMSTLEMIRHLSHVQDSLRGVVLDLRKNPGGLVPVAVGISAIFLKPESTVTIFERPEDMGKAERRAVYEDYKTAQWSGDAMRLLSPAIKTVPLAVLVDNGSSSGSEMIAGALQDYGRAIIVGTQTPGNTSIQTIFPLDNSDAIKLTTNRWLSPKRRSFAGTGVKPDIVVPDRNSKVGDTSGSDLQFAAAVRAVQQK
jgi:carboxyl-terminal processing protease